MTIDVAPCIVEREPPPLGHGGGTSQPFLVVDHGTSIAATGVFNGEIYIEVKARCVSEENLNTTRAQSGKKRVDKPRSLHQ